MGGNELRLGQSSGTIVAGVAGRQPATYQVDGTVNPPRSRHGKVAGGSMCSRDGAKEQHDDDAQQHG